MKTVTLQIEADVVFHHCHGEISLGASEGLEAEDWTCCY